MLKSMWNHDKNFKTTSNDLKQHKKMLIGKNWRQLGKMTIIDPNGDFLGKTMLEYGFGLCRSKYHHHICSE